MTDRFVRPKEVAFRVGVSKSTLYYWIKEHRFPAQTKIGGGKPVGWLESVVDDWIDASRRGDFSRLRSINRSHLAPRDGSEQ